MRDTLARRSCGEPQARCSHVTASLMCTANHPAPQRHAAFTPAGVPSPNGMDSRKRTSHRSRAKPHGTATSQTQFDHIPLSYKLTSSEATAGRICFSHYICTPESPRPQLPALHLHYQVPSSEGTPPRSCFHYNISTTKLPVLVPQLPEAASRTTFSRAQHYIFALPRGQF